MDLRFVRTLSRELSEHSLGNPLRASSLERSFTSEAMALDPSKAVRHQLVGAAVMRFRAGHVAKVRKLKREPGLNAISVRKMRQRFLVHLRRSRNQPCFVETIRFLRMPDGGHCASQERSLLGVA